MGEPIEDEYFNWLYTKVGWRENYTPSTKYQSLLYLLHCTEFTWRLSGDDNRAEDGEDLRREFLREVSSRPGYDEWAYLPCSVLEMLIAFARRAEFQTTYSLREWFWIFIENLGLSDISDANYKEKAELIGPILEAFIWRTYDEHGNGGLFPIKGSEHDQRKIEIWYQFCEYLIENEID
jgi:hypothetical protein